MRTVRNCDFVSSSLMLDVNKPLKNTIWIYNQIFDNKINLNMVHVKPHQGDIWSASQARVQMRLTPLNAHQ